MATTLAQFYQEEASRYGKWLKRVGAETDAARTDRGKAQQKLDEAHTAHDALTASIAANRARLPSTTVPAEAQALVQTIAAQVVVERQLATALRDQRCAVADADARLAALADQTRRLEPKVSELGAAATRAAADAVIRDKWKQDVAVTPFSDLAHQAGDTKTGAAFTKAQGKINAIPQKLRDLADARRTAALALYTTAEAQQTAIDNARLAELQAAPAGITEQLALAWLNFRGAAADLGDFATTAAARLARARAVIDQLSKDGAVAISDDEVAATSGTVKTDAEAALGKETDHLAADKGETNALSTLGVETRKLLATDPTLDPKAATSLDDERAAEVLTAKKVSDTHDAWKDAPRTAIDKWAGILSDDTWRTLVSFLEASATLDDLVSLGDGYHTTLLDALTTAETALIGKLEAAGAADRRRLYLELEAAATRATVADLAGSRDSDLFLSLRSNP
jgi:hypothetical protein